MEGKRPSGLRNVILVWVIGLVLGIGAGALTAMLLLPSDAPDLPVESLADRLNRKAN
jgi:hypothetical protein